MLGLLTGLREQITMKESLPREFMEGFLHNFCFTWILFALSVLLSPRIWGALPKEKKSLWHTTVTAMIQPLYVGYCAFPDIVACFQWWLTHPLDGAWMDYKPNGAIYYATGLSCGYMLMDCMCMAIWAPDMIKALRKPLYMQMWAHHVLSILFWPFALCCHINTISVIYFVFTEITNPCLNLRWVMESRPGWGNGIPYYLCGATLLLWFFVIRIMPLPWFLLHLALPATYTNCTWLYVGCTLTLVPIPFLLNAFWFKLMIRKVVRLIKGEGGGGVKRKT